MPLNPTEQAAVDRMAATTPADFDGNGYELNFPNRLNDAAIGIGAAGREIATTAASAAAAKTSQDAAKASQDAAKASETAAAGSATAAGTARTGAEGARDAAVTARQDAESARDTAQGHRTAASNSATAAAGSATTAGDAKTTAETARDAATAARTGSETARDASVAARTGAEAAASQSQEGAARLSGTSTTPRVPAIGSLAFTTQAGKGFAVGSWLMVQSLGSIDRWAFGKVSAYNSSTGAVTVQAEAIGADQSQGNDWNLLIAGARGPATPLDGFGYNQTWQTVTRAIGTRYQNATSKPISLTFYYQGGSGILVLRVSPAATGAPSVGFAGQPNIQAAAVIPPGHYYSIENLSGSPSQVVANELR